jgi:hypothetical protein
VIINDVTDCQSKAAKGKLFLNAVPKKLAPRYSSEALTSANIEIPFGGLIAEPQP